MHIVGEMAITKYLANTDTVMNIAMPKHAPETLFILSAKLLTLGIQS